MRVIMATVAAGLIWVAAATHVTAWGDTGHQLVARIAARTLSTAARRRIVTLLRKASPDDLGLKALLGQNGAPQPPPANVEAAFARLATWPDHMPDGKGVTGPWHYVDIGLFEGPSHLAERCPSSGCVSERIPLLAANIKAGKSLTVTASGSKLTFPPARQLRFLIHFLGDIHQPLHSATNADAGGNCVATDGFAGSTELHQVWDTALVRAATQGLANPAKSIIQEFQADMATVMSLTDADAIARESFRLAELEVYGRTRPAATPVIDHFVDLRPNECGTKAPQAIRDMRVNGPASYNTPATLKLVRARLFAGGIRLAAILEKTFE